MANSRFTNAGLALLASYEQSPANKRPFSKMKIGTLTDADYNNADLYDGSETDLHGTAKQLVESVETTVDPNDPTGRTARVKATIIPNAYVKGETIREVGLYITDGGTDWLVWIGKFPATYIPAADEPDMATNLVVTIPIQFNSAASVAISTNSANFALKTELDEVADELDEAETEIAEMKSDFIPVYLTEHADNSELLPGNVSHCVRFNTDGTYEEYSGNGIDATLLTELQSHNYFCKIGDRNGNCTFEKSGRLNFSCNIYGLGTFEQSLNFDFCLKITAESHTHSSITPAPIVPLYFLVVNNEFWVTYYNGRPYPSIVHPPMFGCGFFIPFK